MKNVVLSALAFVLVVPCAVPLEAAPDEGPPSAPVAVSEALDHHMAPQLWVPGTVVSRNQARIAAEVAGRLVSVADIGDFIAKGDILARIDVQALQLQLRTDEATVRRLQASLEYTDQQVIRLRHLTEQQVVAPNDLEEIEAQKRTIEQEIVAAEVGRDQTLYRLERTAVRAPFSGRIAERLQQPGGYVNIGGEVVYLVDTDNVEVRARAPLAVAPFVREGMKVTVDDRSRRSEAQIRRAVSVGDERSRMFEIRVALEGDWMIGSAVRVALPSDAPREVIAVPRDALILRADNTYVFKVIADGTVERVAVETGSGTSTLVAIEGDVHSGDRVVIRGGERLRPGQNVAVEGDEEGIAAGAGP